MTPTIEYGWRESEGIGARPDYEPTIQDIHRRLNAENIDLRGQLEMSRKATSAAQELLENTRSKLADLEAKYLSSWEDYQANAKLARAALDTERLLRTNDAATIADLQRQLHEATGQLKAQRYSVSANVATITGSVFNVEWYQRQRNRLAAENAELRRTISLMAKTAAEVQDNFRLIAELAADPADEARKEPKP